MAPTYIKGGVWSNVEDEILRAAISKYGLNQWARVSSLLARKTAKQVKARWFEWLDPTIKKIEWSREEDEKLLHLAKLMPTQWRTIAPVVGRTATQCIERYQKLLDDAEQQDDEKNEFALTGVGADASAPTGARKYRAGDIDPTPESKPARPDAIDMDEDEKEMLSEARARLANTQGKKAKRKDRERILDESRRLAMLQKRRELKLAGINTKLTQKRKGQVDYNADIPFEHKPAAGFYDISDEQDMNSRKKNSFDLKTHHKGILMKESVDKDHKDRKRNRDPEAAAASAEQSANARAERLLELNQADKIAKRRKLVLPAPQVNDEELEQIVKHGSRGDRIREIYGADELGTGALVGEYKDRVIGESIRTPQIDRSDDRILQSVRDIHALTNEQSSLLGDANTPLHDSSFSSRTILPTHSVAHTPNLLAMRTPGHSSGIYQTPRRDGLGVNKVDVSATPRETLRKGFQTLPKPLNNFDIVMPDDDEEEEQGNSEAQLVEDAGERERQLEKQREIERQNELLRRSQALQKNLPRPTETFKEEIFVTFPNDPTTAMHVEINKLVSKELSRLTISDNNKYPISGKPPSLDTIPVLDDDLKSRVEKDIEDEVSKTDLLSLNEEFSKALDNQPHFLPGMESYESDNEDDTSLSKEIFHHLSEVAKNANKAEQKLTLTMGGYSKRQALLVKKLEEAFTALVELQKERSMYEDLKEMEAVAISARLNELQEEVNFLADAERKGQDHYRELQSSLGL